MLHRPYFGSRRRSELRSAPTRGRSELRSAPTRGRSRKLPRSAPAFVGHIGDSPGLSACIEKCHVSHNDIENLRNQDFNDMIQRIEKNYGPMPTPAQAKENRSVRMKKYKSLRSRGFKPSHAPAPLVFPMPTPAEAKVNRSARMKKYKSLRSRGFKPPHSLVPVLPMPTPAEAKENRSARMKKYKSLRSRGFKPSRSSSPLVLPMPTPAEAKENRSARMKKWRSLKSRKVPVISESSVNDRCKGKNKKGEPCGMKARKGAHYCWHHSPSKINEFGNNTVLENSSMTF